MARDRTNGVQSGITDGKLSTLAPEDFVTRQLNDHHLRLVTVDDPVDVPQSQFVTDWSRLCSAFTTATSIPLNFRAADEEAPVAPVAWSTEVPAVGPFAPGTLSLLQKKTRLGKDRVAAVEELAEQVGELVHQLHDAQRSLWQREAELMTAIPLVVRPDKEPNQLAARFEAILQCGAEALHCHAAAAYILDDDTRHLKMRSHFGLKHSRLTAPPRPLKSARADVEALAGYAVTLCDSEELAEWDVPEPFEAAICVPISTANIPLGTLWLFSHEPTKFTDEQVNIAEIIGSRIAVECEREILLREQGVVGGGGLHMSDAITWQQDSLPNSAAGIEDWQIAARPTTRSRLHGDYYHWFMGRDNNIHLTLATAHDQGVPAALTAATISGLLQQQSISDSIDPAEYNPVSRIQSINASLLATSTGDRHASVACASLNNKDGAASISIAGQTDAFVIRPHSWEHLAKSDATPAGMLDKSATTYKALLESGDILLLISGRPRQPHIHDYKHDGQIDAAHYAEALLHYMHLSVDEMTTVLASLWEPAKSIWETPPALLVARRRE